MSDSISDSIIKLDVLIELVDKIRELLIQQKNNESLIYMDLVEFLLPSIECISQEQRNRLHQIIRTFRNIIHSISSNEE